MKHKYKVSYVLETGEFTKEQLLETNRGGCDQIIIHSIILPPDGSRSELIISADGEGNELSSVEYFKSFFGLAHMLVQKAELSPEELAVCQTAVDGVRDIVLKRRGLK